MQKCNKFKCHVRAMAIFAGVVLIVTLAACVIVKSGQQDYRDAFVQTNPLTE